MKAWNIHTLRLALGPLLDRRRLAVAGGKLALGVGVLVLALPVLTVAWLALGVSDGAFAHLAATVLPAAVRDTLVLMAGVGLLTLGQGVL